MSTQPTENTIDPKLIRAWARAQGIPVGVRGRISAQLRQQYIDAHAAEDGDTR